MAARSCPLRRIAEMVSRPAGTMAGFSQTLPEGIDPSRSRKRFADALFSSPQEETPHPPVRFEEREAQQRNRAQGLARWDAQASDWHRPRRAADHGQAGCSCPAPLAEVRLVIPSSVLCALARFPIEFST